MLLNLLLQETNTQKETYLLVLNGQNEAGLGLLMHLQFIAVMLIFLYSDNACQ